MTGSGSGTSRRRKSSDGAHQRITVGLDMYNLLNNNVTLAFNPRSCRPTRRRRPGPGREPRLHEPAGVPSDAEFGW